MHVQVRLSRKPQAAAMAGQESQTWQELAAASSVCRMVRRDIGCAALWSALRQGVPPSLTGAAAGLGGGEAGLSRSPVVRAHGGERAWPFIHA